MFFQPVELREIIEGKTKKNGIVGMLRHDWIEQNRKAFWGNYSRVIFSDEPTKVSIDKSNFTLMFNSNNELDLIIQLVYQRWPIKKGI